MKTSGSFFTRMGSQVDHLLFLPRLSSEHLWMVFAYLLCKSSQKSLFCQQGLKGACLADVDQLAIASIILHNKPPQDSWASNNKDWVSYSWICKVNGGSAAVGSCGVLVQAAVQLYLAPDCRLGCGNICLFWGLGWMGNSCLEKVLPMVDLWCTQRASWVYGLFSSLCHVPSTNILFSQTQSSRVLFECYEELRTVIQFSMVMIEYPHINQFFLLWKLLVFSFGFPENVCTPTGEPNCQAVSIIYPNGEGTIFFHKVLPNPPCVKTSALFGKEHNYAQQWSIKNLELKWI